MFKENNIIKIMIAIGAIVTAAAITGVVALILLCFAGRDSTPQPVTTDVENLKLSKGINMSGLEYTVRLREHLYKLSTYEDVAKEGFDHIRLPVDFRNYLDGNGDLEDKFLKKLDGIINMANSQGLAVILDFHGWPDFNTEKGDTKIFISIWESLAEHYKDYSNMLLFELINEPHTTDGGDLSMERLMELQCETIEAIRAISPRRTIVIAAPEWNGHWTLKDFTPPEYDNLILAVHVYTTLDFTHQGQLWMGSLNKRVPLDDEIILQLNAALRDIKNFKDRTGMEIVINEFGLTTTGAISDDDIYNYISTITKFAKEKDIGWTYWEYNESFGAYKPGFLRIGGKWRKSVLDGLFLRDRQTDN